MRCLFCHICLLIFLLSSSSLIKAQEDFRIWPYLQQPSTNAMSILWFSEKMEPGVLTWWIDNLEQGHDSASLMLTQSNPGPAEGLVYSQWEDFTYFGGEAPDIPYKHLVRLDNLEAGTTYGYTVQQGLSSASSCALWRQRG